MPPLDMYYRPSSCWRSFINGMLEIVACIRHSCHCLPHALKLTQSCGKFRITILSTSCILLYHVRLLSSRQRLSLGIQRISIPFISFHIAHIVTVMMDSLSVWAAITHTAASPSSPLEQSALAEELRQGWASVSDIADFATCTLGAICALALLSLTTSS